MPIIKDTNASDTAVTIRRFPNGSDIAGLTGVQSLNYISLNRAHYGENELIWGHQSGGTVVIRCELAEDAEGEFYGDYSSLHIRKDGTMISWFCGTNLIGTKTWEKDVHMYGFTPDPTDTTKFLAWYDNERFGTARAFNLSYRAYIGYCYGQPDETTGISSSSGSWAMRIWDLTAHWGNTWYHLYPVYHLYPDDHSDVELMETRTRTSDSDLDFKTASTPAGSSSSFSAGPTIAWGVSIHDLKNAFGSPYNDILAITCGDNGFPSSGADPADKLTNGTSNHNMAFRMADGTGTTVSNPMPLPSGYTVSRSGTYSSLSYVKGDLILGRKPKWPIWADNIKWGKYVQMQDSIPYLRYNIFKDYKNDDIDEVLLRWDGLDTAGSKNHEPSFVVGTIHTEFHNRVCCICNREAWLIDGAKSSDGLAVFKYNNRIDGTAGINIGNLAPWDLTYDQVSPTNWIIRGAGVTLRHDINGMMGDFASFVRYGSGSIFCSTNTTDKNTFQGNTLYISEAKMNNDSGDALYRIIVDNNETAMWGSDSTKIQMKASIGLFNFGESVTPTEQNTIHTDYVLPQKTSDMICSRNPSTITSSNTDQYYAGKVSAGEDADHLNAIFKMNGTNNMMGDPYETGQLSSSGFETAPMYGYDDCRTGTNGFKFEVTEPLTFAGLSFNEGDYLVGGISGWTKQATTLIFGGVCYEYPSSSTSFYAIPSDTLKTAKSISASTILCLNQATGTPSSGVFGYQDLANYYFVVRNANSSILGYTRFAGDMYYATSSGWQYVQGRTDRLVCGELDGKCTIHSTACNINIVLASSQSTALDWSSFQLAKPGPIDYGMCIGAQVAAQYGESSLMDMNSYPIMAYIEVTEVTPTVSGDMLVEAGYKKYYGFTSAITTKYSDNNWSSPSAYSTWWNNASTAYPSELSVDGNDYDDWKAVIWKWQELMRTSGTSVQPSGGITAHMKIFEQSNGPVAWDIHGQGNWDDVCGQRFVEVTKNSTTYRLYFADSDRLIPYDSSNYNLADCWFTVWKQENGVWTQQKGSSFTMFSLSVKIREITLHTPHGSTTPVIDGTEKATLTLTAGGSAVSSNNFTGQLSSAMRNPTFSWLPSGYGDLEHKGYAGKDLDGFYNLTLKGTASTYNAGSLYTLQFS